MFGCYIPRSFPFNVLFELCYEVCLGIHDQFLVSASWNAIAVCFLFYEFGVHLRAVSTFTLVISDFICSLLQSSCNILLCLWRRRKSKYDLPVANTSCEIEAKSRALRSLTLFETSGY